MLKLALGTAAAVMLTALPAQAQERQLSPADRADLNCLVIVAAILGEQAESGEDMAGGIGGLMYYLGRLEGRTPGVDWLEQAGYLLEDPKGMDFEAEAMRCGEELVVKGQYMIDWGEATAGK